MEVADWKSRAVSNHLASSTNCTTQSDKQLLYINDLSIFHKLSGVLLGTMQLKTAFSESHGSMIYQRASTAKVHLMGVLIVSGIIEEESGSRAIG